MTGGLRSAEWLDARRLRIYPKLFLLAYLFATGLFLLTLHGSIDRNGQPVGPDFVGIYGAGALALRGTPAAAYDPARQYAAEQAAVSSRRIAYYGWLYPPTFMIAAAALARLPYSLALAAWVLIGGACYLLVMRLIVRVPEAWWLVLAFPGAVVCLANGQNGCITMALLGGGLLLLEHSPLAAGVCFGLLTYKPQFAVLVPAALLAGRYWRALFGSGFTAAAFAALSLRLFGASTWRAFLASLPITRARVLEQGAVGFYKLQSAFSAARMWGLPTPAAYAVHALVAIPAVAIVVWLWRIDAPRPLRHAALVCATLLFSPFVYDYDLVALALPIAWLGTLGANDGFLPYEKFTLACAWLLPLVARNATHFTDIPVAPMTLAALLVFTARRATLAAVRGVPAALSA